MSAYITRWCPSHGEWDEDVDNPSACPTCASILFEHTTPLPWRIKSRTDGLVNIYAGEHVLALCLGQEDAALIIYAVSQLAGRS